MRSPRRGSRGWRATAPSCLVGVRVKVRVRVRVTVRVRVAVRVRMRVRALAGLPCAKRSARGQV